MQLFIGQPTGRGWSREDLAKILTRLGSCIPGQRYVGEYGATDDGDAWFAVDDIQEDCVLLQIMRVGDQYAVALDAYRELSFAETIDAAIDAAVNFLTLLVSCPEQPNG
jgi:hypothetical protein